MSWLPAMGGRDASQEIGLEDQWTFVSPHLELGQQEGQTVGELSVRKQWLEAHCGYPD